MRMSRIARLIVALGLLAAPVAMGGSATAADPPPVNSNPFEIDKGFVATVEPAGPTHTQFTLDCPIEAGQAQPVWLTSSTDNPACQGGQLTIYVTSATKLYKRDAQGRYAASTYDAMLAPGGQVRVLGRYARQQFSHYQFVANYVFTPGDDMQPQPANPAPQTPCTGAKSLCTTDYNGNRRFVVDATVVQNGNDLIANTLWSDKWGLVAGHITDYFSNDHAKAIANAHRDPVTLDPQLSIFVNDVGVAGTPLMDQGLTKFYVQGIDGRYSPATKAQTVLQGSQLRVLGSYQFVDGDWRFLARAVLRPQPAQLNTSLIFNSQTTYKYDNTNGASHYEGQSNAGDGKINPSNVTFDIAWVQNDDGNWSAVGSWTAVRTDGAAAAGGGITGTWKPGLNRLDATVTVDMTNGTLCGYSGAGTINGGTALPNVDGTPAQILQTPFTLQLNKLTDAAC
jgi:hypothetical protein